jgi:hypothetical protein
MQPEDPRWASVLNELSQLTQLRRAAKFASESVVDQSKDELARELTRPKALVRPSNNGNCRSDNAA